jgi:hypothetical protein
VKLEASAVGITPYHTTTTTIIIKLSQNEHLGEKGRCGDL